MILEMQVLSICLISLRSQIISLSTIEEVIMNLKKEVKIHHHL